MARVSRRDFNKLVGIFGATTMVGVLAKAARAGEPTRYIHLAQRAEEEKKAEAARAAKAKVNLRFGVSGHSPATSEVLRIGIYEFKDDVAKRTNGEVNIELFGGNSLCTELTCIQKCLTGTMHGFNSSTQNAAHTVPFFNALDFPFMFPDRASMYHFFYHPRSEAIFRKPLREKFNVEFLWTTAELRNIFMGQKWRDRPPVRRPDDIKGAKIRVTGSDLGRIAVGLFGANPVPLDWAETLEGLKSGVVDGQETFSTAAGGFNMGGVTGQEVVVGYFPGTEMTAMDSRVFGKLDSKVQNAIRDSAFMMQEWSQKENEKSLREKVGVEDPPKPGTLWAKHGVKVNVLTRQEREEWIRRASPQHNPKPYEVWRERITKLSGGTDMYAEITKIINELPAGTAVEAVKPRKWWIAA
jgi:TRAP-type C4-dicarboxylate transport system substrate-binding protein